MPSGEREMVSGRHNMVLRPTSQMGHSRHLDRALITSGLPRQTDILRAGRHVSNVPTVHLRWGCTEYRYGYRGTADGEQRFVPVNI